MLKEDSMLDNYIFDLETNLLPFWENAMDMKFGGVYTCYTNKGDERISDRKYIWSQGRFLWLTSELLQLRDENVLNLSNKWEEIMDKTYEFLIEHAHLENGNIAFVIERDGQHFSDSKDDSIFADCFYILGCSAYARYKNKHEAFESALEAYANVKARLNTNAFKTDPYPIPKGYNSFSLPMILINVIHDLYQTAQKLKDDRSEMLSQDMNNTLEEMKQFFDEERIIELKPIVDEDKHSLLYRHMNPGHTLEAAWFMYEVIESLNNVQHKEMKSHIEKICGKTLETGWDREHGGLYRFIDKTGQKPTGETSREPIEQLIVDTWDMKLWWPHSEALYTTLLFAKETKSPYWENWYKKLEEYCFQTFPNEDQCIGEWIQIRNRVGEPEEKVVALPVKDPFHIIRNYILMIRLLKVDK